MRPGRGKAGGRGGPLPGGLGGGGGAPLRGKKKGTVPGGGGIGGLLGPAPDDPEASSNPLTSVEKLKKLFFNSSGGRGSAIGNPGTFAPPSDE